MTPHRMVNPDSLPAPSGFSYAVEAAAGRTIYLGGHVAHDDDGRITGDSMADQFALAAANLVVTLREAGAEPHHLVSLQIYVTNVQAYKRAARPIGVSYRRHFGSHYPAMALFGVARLYDPAALVELVGIAVVPA